MASNREIVERALAHFGHPATRASYFDLYSPDVVMHGYAGLESGLDNVKAFYAGMWTAFPDARVEIEDIVESGEKLVFRFAMTGTHEGVFNGIPGTGKAVRLPGIAILKFQDGRCVERWSVADFLQVLGQIGAL